MPVLEGGASSPMIVDETATASPGGDIIMDEQTLPSSEVIQQFKAVEEPMLAPLMDLVEYIPGMYRILDLVSEQGSGGLGNHDLYCMSFHHSCELPVDKIIISQESFGRFVNAVSPGAYQSMTHVSFEALDKLNLRPIGIYGSKSEIVRYLQDLKFVDSEMSVFIIKQFITDIANVILSATLLLNSTDDVDNVAQKSLRSGLYFINDVPKNFVYVLYWPQDTTWNDNTISAVSRNRETFMR
jgi:hypothetical protein